MIVYLVSVHVLPGYEKDFKKATSKNREGTLKEAGNICFDVLQSDKETNQFLIYEIYRSEEALEAHKASKHYKTWRESVAPLMARERKGSRYTRVCLLGDEEDSS